MSFKAAKRLDGVSESATLKLNALVQAMRARGEDIVNLTAGEPDFPAPEEAKAAIRRALDENKNKYTPVAGIPEVRERIAKKTNVQQPNVVAAHGEWKASEVVVTNGGKQAIYNAAMALLNPGDEVLIPAPYWLSYPEMVKLAEGKPVVVETKAESKFKVTVEGLRKALTPKTKLLILNSPSNPTGTTYTRAEFEAIGKWLEKEAPNVWVLSDEIYDRILYGQDPFVSFLDAAPALRNRSITVNGLSKAAAMTGWRIGWTVAPAELTQAMLTLQGQSTSGINSLAQYAAVAALDLAEEKFAEMVAAFRRRRRMALEILAKAEKLKVVPPEGAFYVFLGIEAFVKPGEDSMTLSENLIREAKVAVVPGTPFGAPNWVRISIATDDDTLKKGCERLVSFFGG
ncbi:MAG: pyridoxal phosphate-dependent aminotransferase [Bdellovibrionales bacterium]|nr:pyridoxal phosphate-dependent aminotransferase [Bdellovibrionales bacterium]